MWVEPIVAALTADHSTRLWLPANAEDLLVGRFDSGGLQEDASGTDSTRVDHNSPCNVLAPRDLYLGCRNSHFSTGRHSLYLPFIRLAGLRAAWLAVPSNINTVAPLLRGSFLVGSVCRLDRN